MRVGVLLDDAAAARVTGPGRVVVHVVVEAARPRVGDGPCARPPDPGAALGLVRMVADGATAAAVAADPSLRSGAGALVLPLCYRPDRTGSARLRAGVARALRAAQVTDREARAFTIASDQALAARLAEARRAGVHTVLLEPWVTDDEHEAGEIDHAVELALRATRVAATP